MRTYEDYKLIGRPFASKFDGQCAIDSRHRVHRKDTVSFVQLKENPHITVEGVACKSCVMVIDD
jgi:hypothetical protein